MFARSTEMGNARASTSGTGNGVASSLFLYNIHADTEALGKKNKSI